jgi:hypothetical protein
MSILNRHTAKLPDNISSLENKNDYMETILREIWKELAVQNKLDIAISFLELYMNFDFEIIDGTEGDMNLWKDIFLARVFESNTILDIQDIVSYCNDCIDEYQNSDFN